MRIYGKWNFVEFGRKNDGPVATETTFFGFFAPFLVHIILCSKKYQCKLLYIKNALQKLLPKNYYQHLMLCISKAFVWCLSKWTIYLFMNRMLPVVYIICPVLSMSFLFRCVPLCILAHII